MLQIPSINQMVFVNHSFSLLFLILLLLLLFFFFFFFFFFLRISSAPRIWTPLVTPVREAAPGAW
jgi:hypothetical protein